MSEVLITGGNGFLGRNIISILIEKGYKITNLSPNNCPDSRVRNISFDAFIDSLDSLLQGLNFEYVIHLAGYPSPKLASDFEKTIKLNVELTSNLLASCQRMKNLKRFFFFSSATTYSDEAKRPLKEESAQLAHEGDNYAYSKIEAEKICKKYQKSGMPISILRVTNCFGPYQDWKNKPNLIPQIIREAITEKKISIQNGNYKRDFLYSKDLAKIISNLINSNISFDILNIATGIEHEVGEIAEYIASQLGVPVYDSKAEISKAKSLLLDITKLTSIMPEFKFTKFEDALEETLNYYKSAIQT